MGGREGKGRRREEARTLRKETERLATYHVACRRGDGDGGGDDAGTRASELEEKVRALALRRSANMKLTQCCVEGCSVGIERARPTMATMAERERERRGVDDDDGRTEDLGDDEQKSMK